MARSDKMKKMEEALERIARGPALADEAMFARFAQKRAREALAPDTHTIGGIEVPAPVREPLEKGQEYWMVYSSMNKGVLSRTWRSEPMDYRDLRRGLIHLTEEAAVANAKAEVKARGGEW